MGDNISNGKIAEVGDEIYQGDYKTDLSAKKIKYLTKNEKVTALVITKMYDTVVTVLIGIPEKEQISMITNEGKIDEVDWEKVYKKTKNIHETMKKWAAKKEAK